MDRKLKQRMRRDCRAFMRTPILAELLHGPVRIASPMVTAWLIGDMANHLLTLNTAAIASGMPLFLCAVFFQVVVAMLLDLAGNLLLTRKGFDYDGFLMEKYIRLPYKTLQTMEAGAFMERLYEDSAEFCFNQVALCTNPFSIGVSIAVFCGVMADGECPVLFALLIVLLAAIPVYRAAHIGKRQTQLKKEVSEYSDKRRQMEQELFDVGEFARSFSLEDFFVGRLHCLFSSFMQKTGTIRFRMDALTEVLDYLCTYGVQAVVILMGALLIARGELTLGAMLSGYLMIPAVKKCCGYIKALVLEIHDEKKCLDRLSFFYEAEGESEDSSLPLAVLETDKVSFSYDGSEKPALSGVDFRMTRGENIRLVGANGSGKTTLISLLAGLYEPESGTVCSHASVSQRRKSIALQEQDGAIFSGSVWENLFLPESRRDVAAYLLRRMGLEKSLDYEITAEGGNLSPGERKKLLLARALLRNAPFLVLDEPLNHLDAQGKEALLDELAKRSEGILMVSHQELAGDSLKWKLFDIQAQESLVMDNMICN